MCGRYYIEVDDVDMRDTIKAVLNNLSNAEHFPNMKSGEIFPTNIVPIQTGVQDYTLMRWGFTKFDGKGNIINARSETAFEKPMFRKPLMESRCLIPASYYFEWEKVDARKVKHAFRHPDSKILYLAGIYRMERGSEMPVFAILTKNAVPHIAHIHDRMPVIIPFRNVQDWLQGGPDAMKHALGNVVASPA